jgi:hypothetical protein
LNGAHYIAGRGSSQRAAVAGERGSSGRPDAGRTIADFGSTEVEMTAARSLH